MKSKKIVIKVLLVAIIIALSLIILPNNVNAAVTYTRTTLGSNGSMEISFKGLKLDKKLEYEYGFTKTAAAKPEQWELVTEYAETTAKITLSTTTKYVKEVIDAVDTGYITIREKATQKVVVEPYSIDLKIPYLEITNYMVINNGKEFNTNTNGGIQVPLRCAKNSKAFYQYEKITDQKVIDKFKEIKSKKGNYSGLQSLLKTKAPTSGWKNWSYFNGYFVDQPGYGFTESPINVPEEGLYYMWLYFSGDNIKNLYGYILVDNLAPEIPLDGLSLPKTADVELGKTITLTPTFNPTTTTNKIVKWTSSDENVATVDNSGKITSKKIGSTIITVTSQDGSKKATCTVTVKTASSGNEQNGNNGSNNSQNGTNNGNNSQGVSNSQSGNGAQNGSNTKNEQDKGNDKTTIKGKIPQAGASYTVLGIAIVTIIAGSIIYIRYRKMKDII